MSPQPSDPSESSPGHPSSGAPDAEPLSPRGSGGDQAQDASSQAGADAGPRPAEWGSAQQPTPQQPYDQQTPPGYGQPGYPPGGYGQQPYPGQQTQPGQPYLQTGGQPGYPQQGLAPVSASDEKLWALLSHLSVPFFGFVVPLVVYLVFKDRSAWLKDSAVEALNFSILYTIAITASAILAAFLIGLVLMPLVWIVAVVFCVLATVAANRHELYRYPVNWRLVS